MVHSVKALGIVFTYNEVDLLQKNFYDKLKDIRMRTRLWSCRGLSLYGKVTIIKSLLIPKMLYVFSILPTPEDFIKQLNSIIHNFLWKGPDKIAQLATINYLKHGGLDLIDIVETSIKASRLAWIGRLFESIIWNNKNIKIDGKPIYYPNYVKAGILFCHHLITIR